YEAIRRIRAQVRFQSLPIIAVTAKAMKGDAEKCLEAGATDYLTKPIDPVKLVEALHKVLPHNDKAQDLIAADEAGRSS
ncbi:MAG: response regulator, partial [Myxococcales bacterium]